MKKNAGQLVGEIYALLKDETDDDKLKIISSVSTLLSVAPPQQNTYPNNRPTSNHSNLGSNPGSTGNGQDAKAFFDLKSPQNKGEEFAVAAKFRLDNELGEEHSKEDLKAIIKSQAKRVFDEKNFKRDMDNAKRQSKLFIAGESKNSYVLSAFGEKYVNALPDREGVRHIKKGGKKMKKVASKKTVKKGIKQ